jgi:hypothetical protein
MQLVIRNKIVMQLLHGIKPKIVKGKMERVWGLNVVASLYQAYGRKRTNGKGVRDVGFLG